MFRTALLFLLQGDAPLKPMCGRCFLTLEANFEIRVSPRKVVACGLAREDFIQGIEFEPRELITCQCILFFEDTYEYAHETYVCVYSYPCSIFGGSSFWQNVCPLLGVKLS